MRFNRVKKFIAVCLSLMFVVCSAFGGYGTVSAATKSELQSKKQKIQSQIDSAQSKINKLSKEKDKTEDYVTALQQKIEAMQDKIDVLQKDSDDLQSSINTIQSKINDAEAEIDRIQKEIDSKQAEFDKLFDEYCQRLRAMYVSGSVSNLEVLLTSSDISSILTRSQMIKSVSQKDSKALDILMKKMEQIEKDKAKLEKTRADLNANKQSLLKDKQELQSNINNIASSKKELDSEVSEANVLIKKLSNQKTEYMETISSSKEEMQRVENQIQAIIAANSSKGSGSYSGGSGKRPGGRVSDAMSGSSSGSGSSNGRFCYPTKYHTVSGGYPNYSSGKYHGGLDFPCPTGTSVVAAGSGKVIFAGWNAGGYGNLVMIDHGNGLVSLYGHNSSVVASVGQHVKKGQLIARSGSTGRSTGPHVHFEVRVNGTRVSPWNYL